MAIGGKGDGPSSQTILVVGGGIAGITAALEAAEVGQDVILVEREASLGGRVTRLNRYFPKLCHPTCGLEINYQRLRKNPRVKVLTMCEVVDISGVARRLQGDGQTPSALRQRTLRRLRRLRQGEPDEGRQSVQLRPRQGQGRPICRTSTPSPCATSSRRRRSRAGEGDKLAAACRYGAIDPNDKGESFDLRVGAVVWATGWRPYDPMKLDVYSYGHSPDIVTNVEMERLAAHNGPTQGKIVRPSNGEPAKKDRAHPVRRARATSTTCPIARASAASARSSTPPTCASSTPTPRCTSTTSTFAPTISSRPSTTRSEPIRRSRSSSRSRRISASARTARPILHGERTIEREIYAEPYDLVVLATGMQPSAVAGYRPHFDVAVDDYGFLTPQEGDGAGIFSAGVASGPLDVSMSVQSATAAALKAVQAVRGA